MQYFCANPVTKMGDVFAEDLFCSLDFVLTLVSVVFNYTGPFFLK